MTRTRFMAALAILLASFLATASAQTDKKALTFKGKVEKVDAKAKTLTVAGEKVDGWMGAMTMTYSPDKDEVLTKVKAGDEITAKVYAGDFKVLHDIEVVPPKEKNATKK